MIMVPLMTRLSIETIGLAIVLFALYEVFSDIFHPTRSGNLSDAVGKLTSTLFRNTRLRSSVGPLALIVVILSWVSLLVLGFALIYSGLFPEYFVSRSGELSVSFGKRFVHCLYFSLGAISTFETFDLDPRTAWLRLIVACEGLVGISMITASVSWLVLLYPALERTRQLSRRISSLVKAQEMTGLSLIENLGVSTLTELAQAFVRLRLDLILFPILLHFHAADDAAAIGPALPHALTLSTQGLELRRPDNIRLAAAELHIALQELSHTLADRVLHTAEDDILTIFQAFRERE